MNKTKETMLESISLGCRDINKMSYDKQIELASAYLDECEIYDMDPVIELTKPNVNMLRNFLDAHTEQKINQLKLELANAVIAEHEEELEDLFEQCVLDFEENLYNDYYE